MKECPQCGQTQDDAVKFCINCGYKFEANIAAATPAANAAAAATPTPAAQPAPQQQAQTQAQATGPQQTPPTPPTPPFTQPTGAQTPPPAPNETIEKAKHASRNYWGWLVRCLAHPSDDAIGGDKFFGLASLLLISLFNTLALVKPLANATGAASGAVSQAESGFNSLFGTNSTAASSYASQTAGSVVFGTGLRLILLFVVLHLVIFSCAYLAQRVVAPQKFGYLEAMTEFGRYLALPVFFSAVSAVIGFLGGVYTVGLTGLLMAVSFGIENIAFYQIALSHGKKQGGLDSVYGILFVSLLMGFCVLLVLTIFGGSIVSMLGDIF